MKTYDYFNGVEQTKKYSEKTSLSLALACKLAYKNENKIKKQVEKWGYDFIDFISIVKEPDIHTQCYVMSDDKNIIIVFRGTDNINGWIGNFQAVYDPGPLEKTKAHEGFQDALFPSVLQLTELVKQAKPKSKKIWITGHSLGGALSSLYAGMLSENGYNVYGIYTFASPRPGNGDFQVQLNNKINGPHYRIANSGDMVPHLPPEPFFSHPGKRIILYRDGRSRKKSAWRDQKINALDFFIKCTSKLFKATEYHSLNENSNSYIPRLINDLEARYSIKQKN